MLNKKELLDEFKIETYRAIERGISLNPVLNSFQKVVNDYKIDLHLIETFLKSMEMDLEKKEYTEEGYKEYILGSAEVVGLMCLRVFVKGNQKMYDDLTPYAMALGSAFQKINFLRDLHADYLGMGRVYFPNVEIKELDPQTKAALEDDIEIDFEFGLGRNLLYRSTNTANQNYGKYPIGLTYHSLTGKLFDYKENLLSNKLYLFDGFVYNKEEAGNVLWGATMAYYHIPSIASLIGADVYSTINSLFNESSIRGDEWNEQKAILNGYYYFEKHPF